MRNVRMSPQKMREVVRQIQGLPAQQAQAVLAVVPRKGARLVAKTLKSAIANADDLKTHKPEYNGMNTDKLVIKALGKDSQKEKIQSISLLGSNGKIDWKQAPEQLEISVPAELSGKHVWAFKIELEEAVR